MVIYVPGTEETDPKKQNMSLQQIGAAATTLQTSVAALNSATYVNSIAGNNGAFALTGGITNLANAIKLALNNVTLQASVAAPTSTTSVTGVMMGMGSTFHITPTYSGRIHITICGTITGAAAVIGFISIRFGTGTAPANGVAPTGTVVGSSGAALVNNISTAAAGSQEMFSKSAIITGLTPGAAYWFDLTLASNNTASVSISNVDCSGFEF